MRRFDPFWEFPAVAHHPVQYPSFRQTALAGGFAPVAQRNAEHTDLFTLGDDLGLSLWSRLLLLLAVILLGHVRMNRYARLKENAISNVTSVSFNAPLHLRPTESIGPPSFTFLRGEAFDARDFLTPLSPAGLVVNFL